MEYVYYDPGKRELRFSPLYGGKGTEISLGWRSDLEVKMIESEIERGTFKVEEWRKR